MRPVHLMAIAVVVGILALTQSSQAEMLLRLELGKAHVLLGHGFGDRLGIARKNEIHLTR